MLFVSTTFVGLSNFGFQAVMSRLLGPSRYGALGSLLGLVTILTVVVGALQVAVVQAVAANSSNSNAAVGSALAGHLALRKPAAAAAGLAAVGVVVFGALSPLMEGFLHLTSSVPVVLFGVFVGIGVLTLLPQGVLLGRLDFKVVAVAGAAGAVVRIAVGIVLVEAGFGLDGAVMASVVSSAVMIAGLVWPLRHELMSAVGDRIDLHGRTIALSVAAVSGSAAFMAVAPILTRHYLANDASGYFVAANQAAQMALFVPGAVALVAFPRFAALPVGSIEARRMLLQSLSAVGILGGVTAGVLDVAPHPVISVLFGSSYQAAAGALQLLAVAGGAIALVNLLMYFHLGRRSLVAAASWPGVGLLVGLIMVFHGGLVSISAIVVGATALVRSVMTVAALKAHSTNAADEPSPVVATMADTLVATSAALPGDVGCASQCSAGAARDIRGTEVPRYIPNASSPGWSRKATRSPGTRGGVGVPAHASGTGSDWSTACRA